MDRYQGFVVVHTGDFEKPDFLLFENDQRGIFDRVLMDGAYDKARVLAFHWFNSSLVEREILKIVDSKYSNLTEKLQSKEFVWGMSLATVPKKSDKYSLRMYRGIDVELFESHVTGINLSGRIVLARKWFGFPIPTAEVRANPRAYRRAIFESNQ